MKVIITGATGMVGEEVVHVCLADPSVEHVVIVNRSPANIAHPKLEEVLHKDFFDLSSIADKLRGYDACLFCLGVSSVGMKEDKYTQLTYDLTLNFARTVVALNPDMTFCYISGAGTDSTEKGRNMWARVKGRTENDLLKMPFKRAYMFRPGYLHPSKGMQHTNKLYAVFGILYPILKGFLPQYVCTLKELAQAMIKSVSLGYEKQVLDVPDIKALAVR